MSFLHQLCNNYKYMDFIFKARWIGYIFPLRFCIYKIWGNFWENIIWIFRSRHILMGCWSAPHSLWETVHDMMKQVHLGHSRYWKAYGGLRHGPGLVRQSAVPVGRWLSERSRVLQPVAAPRHYEMLNASHLSGFLSGRSILIWPDRGIPNIRSNCFPVQWQNDASSFSVLRPWPCDQSGSLLYIPGIRTLDPRAVDLSNRWDSLICRFLQYMVGGAAALIGCHHPWTSISVW